MKPGIGQIVHYVSYGTPGGEYTSQCRAAIIAGLDEHPEQNDPGQVFASLVVLNPTGMFFNQMCLQDEADHTGGTWHWPPRIEEDRR